MPRGLVFASRKNRRNRRSARARRTARRASRRGSPTSRLSRRLHFFGVLKRKQRGGNYAYRIPGYVTRDFQRKEDDGFSQPFMATQDEIARIAEMEEIVG